MAKDPRFSFYVDNWKGGTRRLTLEERGAYTELLLLNYYALNDGLPGFTQEEAIKDLASMPECTQARAEQLWDKIQLKFIAVGEHFYNERMVKEFHKAKKSSTKQSERVSKRYSDSNSNNDATAVDTAVSTCNSISISNKILKEGVDYPAKAEFMDYCREFLGREFPAYEFALDAKYDSWIQNGWRDGHDKEIKNWKTKARTAKSFMRPDLTKIPKGQIQSSEEYSFAGRKVRRT